MIPVPNRHETTVRQSRSNLTAWGPWADNSHVEIVAFTAEHVCKLTGLSMHQLRYWDDTGFFSPTLIDGQRSRAFNRVYNFRDLVGLRTISILRKENGLPLQELRRVGEWLRSKNESPWSSLRLALAGRRIAYFSDSAQEFVEASESEQEVFAVALEPIEHQMERRAEELRKRTKSERGAVVRNRWIVHNAWVIAGTRIPVRAVQNLHDAGYSTQQIIREYPSLTAADVKAALKHESLRAA